MAEPKTKYDRQLRIWGEQGQNALEKASICLLNCGPTGSETLKNLVLGGIGGITVVDGSKVKNSDLGNNFMVSESSPGQPKAKCVCAYLQELNDAVKAKFIEEHPVTLIEANPSFFSQFTLVVATQVSITVVDGSKVKNSDLGNNFMVSESSLGQPKAKCVCAYLQELNDAVKAKFIKEHPVTLIELVEDSMVKLDRICHDANVKLIWSGFVRISVKIQI